MESLPEIYVLLRGEHLQQTNDPVRQRIYAIYSGQFKVYQLSANGRQSVTGFRAAGEFLGLECIGVVLHRQSAVALVDSVVCEFAYPRLAAAALQHPALATSLNRILLEELALQQASSALLCSQAADPRLAAWLLEARWAQRRIGEAGDVIELNMTRSDIGDHLGLAGETVSRTLKRFQIAGYVTIEKHRLTLRDPAALGAIATGSTADGERGQRQ